MEKEEEKVNEKKKASGKRDRRKGTKGLVRINACKDSNAAVAGSKT